MDMRLLNGIKVIELSGGGIKASYCTKLFAEFGADVIKCELPDAFHDESKRIWLDSGKASVVIDWRLPDGDKLLRLLAKTADVVVWDDLTPYFDHTDWETGPGPARLIRVGISDMGSDGPLAHSACSDLVVSALSGMAYINGTAGRLPLREPGNQTAIVAALAGFIGALTALANRTQTGEGQSVDVSALEAMVNVLSPSVLQHSYQGGPERKSSADGFLFDCADGKVSIIISSERSWQTLVELWDLEVDPSDPRLASEGSRRVNLPAVRTLFEPVLRRKTRRELFEELCAVRVPCGMLLSPSELPDDPHLKARGSFCAVKSGGSTHQVPGPSFRIAGQMPPQLNTVPPIGHDTSVQLAGLLPRKGAL